MEEGGRTFRIIRLVRARFVRLFVHRAAVQFIPNTAGRRALKRSTTSIRTEWCVRGLVVCIIKVRRLRGNSRFVFDAFDVSVETCFSFAVYRPRV